MDKAPKADSNYKTLKMAEKELPWWSSGLQSGFPMQGARVRSLVRELDPTCHKERSHMLQLRAGTAKINKKIFF